MSDIIGMIVVLAVEALVPQRAWLDALALAVPGPIATRWLLLCDVACLAALAVARRRAWLAAPFTLIVGFIALNALGLALGDFYLALAAFHVGVAVTTLLLLRTARWAGGAALALAVGLGILT
jgi:hypothetical protein